MAVKPAPALTPKQLAQIAKDNDTAKSALAKRSKTLDKTIEVVDDKLAHDPGLAAYPDATARLNKIKDAAKNGKSVIVQEQEIRGRLDKAAKTGDQEGVKQAQADLTALKKNNPKIYGKSSTASPKIECPDALSTAACDAAISQVTYKPKKDPSTWTKGPASTNNKAAPCYGTSLAEWGGVG